MDGNKVRDGTLDRTGPKSSGESENDNKKETRKADHKVYQRAFTGRQMHKAAKSQITTENGEPQLKRDFSEREFFGDKKLDKAAQNRYKAKKNLDKVRKKNQVRSYKFAGEKRDATQDRNLAKKKIARKGIYDAAAVARTKGMENSDDNGANDAFKAFASASDRTFDFVTQHEKSSRQIKSEQIEKARKKLDKANAAFDKSKYQYDQQKAHERWVENHSKGKDARPSNKDIQKSRVKKNYAKAARNTKNAEKTAEVAAKTAEEATVIAHKIQEFISKNVKVIAIIAGVLLIFVIIMSMFSSCAAMFGDTVTTTMASAYLSIPADIDAVALRMTELEVGLRETINNIETNYPDYDEYQYNLGNIGINKIKLISYLSAKYTEFTYSGVEGEIQTIFEEVYTLTLTPTTEKRTRIVTKTDPKTGNQYQETEEYEVSVLKVDLTVKDFDEIVNAGLTEDQMLLYNSYQETKGALQIYYPPVDCNWYDCISSYYGYRISPADGTRQLHRGIDIAVSEGTVIYASHDATVTTAAYDDSFGNYIVLTDVNGYITKYGHLSEIDVTEGEIVTMGTPIGKTGNTGSSTGPHLHFECLYNGEYYNPLFYFNSN